MLAARGTRKTNGNEQKIDDATEAAALRSQGKAIWLKSVGLAALLTAALYFIAR